MDYSECPVGRVFLSSGSAVRDVEPRWGYDVHGKDCARRNRREVLMSAFRDAPGNPYALTDDRHHTYNARARLKVASEQLKQDVARVSDERARAMLEVSVAVINALVAALHAHEEGARVQWRRP